MKLLRRAVFVAALFAGITTQVARAEVEFIDPTVNLATPNISFDTNINPVAGTLSGDALNIIRAQRVALQQVQAALGYLALHRADILAGKNTWYNETFGDFYDPNSPFAGLYNRTLQHDTGKLDQFHQPVYETWYNTAHYDRVVYVFKQIQSALNSAITYSWGAQTGNAANAMIFDTYRTGTLTIGDPLFGSPLQPDTITPIPIDPLTGLPVIDPVTMLPVVNPPLLGDPLFSHFAITLPAPNDRGTVEWGYSTSFSGAHLAQIATDPTHPLRWDADNALPGLAFFNDRLDTYATTTTVTDATTLVSTTSSDLYVGGAFLNESQRANSSVTGQPNPFFHPTEFNQYQMIITALAQSAGSLPAIGAATGTSGVAIENGISELFGSSSNFYEALDGNSYAAFVDVFKPIEEGGIGDGTLLPPPGKQGGRADIFVPLVPAS